MGARVHYPTMKQLPGVRLGGVVRARSGAALEEPVFTNFTEALRTVKPDLVVIASPHAYHYDQVRQSLESGANVLCEKPLGLRYEEVEELIEIATRRRLMLCVGLQRRYELLSEAYREVTQQGLLGDIRYLHGLFCHNFPKPEESWRDQPAIAGDGILDDSAFHIIDLLVFLANGKAIDPRAVTLKQGGTVHTFSCIFKTDAGVAVCASGSYITPLNSVQEEITIVGSAGTILSRRFGIDRQKQTHYAVFKSTDGAVTKELDMSRYVQGRQLPLVSLVKYLQGTLKRELIYSEAHRVLETHRIISEIKRHWAA